uniref:(northern house mosquito) hypothetical protein n=1 Tax=Culex pipiens TaxID=7175 RepID=A0A8D8B2T1_CULPI
MCIQSGAVDRRLRLVLVCAVFQPVSGKIDHDPTPATVLLLFFDDFVVVTDALLAATSRKLHHPPAQLGILASQSIVPGLVWIATSGGGGLCQRAVMLVVVVLTTVGKVKLAVVAEQRREPANIVAGARVP